MTARATKTEAELRRAIRAADALGKVALWSEAGIYFVPVGQVPHSAPDSGGNTCDDLFGIQS